LDWDLFQHLVLLVGLYHIVNHAVFKGLLFLCAGAIIYRTGTKDIRKHGLGKTMPITLITYLIAALAISGVTPFNGSVSKSMIEASLYHQPLVLILLSAACIGTVTTFSKILYYSFLKSSKENKQRSLYKEAPLSMQFSMIVLAFFCVVLGVFPHLWLTTIIVPSTSSLISGYDQIQVNFYEPLSLLKEWVIIGLGLLVLKVVVTQAESINKFRKAARDIHLNNKLVFIMCALLLILITFKMIN
jgi:formate hydrogenlyase subunit 3/multisubunit Na+/H+ antiporter MnhD subunit